MTKWNVKEDAGSTKKFLFNNSLKWSLLNIIGDGKFANDQFQFSAASRSERGNQSRRQSGDGGQCIDGFPTTRSSNLGVDAHSTVAGSGNRSVASGRETECLEVAPPNIMSPNFVQGKFNGVDLGEKDAGRPHQL